jgi:hypothetical protein
MNDTIAKLVPTKPDAEVAADLKRRAVEIYQPVLELCTEAHSLGFEVQVMSGMGPLGKHIITGLKVAKVY